MTSRSLARNIREIQSLCNAIHRRGKSSQVHWTEPWREADDQGGEENLLVVDVRRSALPATPTPPRHTFPAQRNRTSAQVIRRASRFTLVLRVFSGVFPRFSTIPRVSNSRHRSGGFPPSAPTDPDVRIFRIRLVSESFATRRETLRTTRGVGSGH
jgi:hypothetical protein